MKGLFARTQGMIIPAVLPWGGVRVAVDHKGRLISSFLSNWLQMLMTGVNV